MFQLDDKFLEDVGLGSLPDDQKRAFLAHTHEELELRVGTKLSEGLSKEQMEEFEAFVDQNMTKVESWFERNMPDYSTRPDFEQFKVSAPTGTPVEAILSEYGSLKWLEKNRPDYRQVVAAELDALKQEISSNKDNILGKSQS